MSELERELESEAQRTGPDLIPANTFSDGSANTFIATSANTFISIAPDIS